MDVLLSSRSNVSKPQMPPPTSSTSLKRPATSNQHFQDQVTSVPPQIDNAGPDIEPKVKKQIFSSAVKIAVILVTDIRVLGNRKIGLLKILKSESVWAEASSAMFTLLVKRNQNSLLRLR